MVINILSVQYNGGLLPDIILLNQGYYHYWGTRLNTMYCSGFVFIATMYYDGVLHCLCFVFTVFLVSLHGD